MPSPTKGRASRDIPTRAASAIQSLRYELCPDAGWDDIVNMARESGYSEIFDVNDEAFAAPKSMAGAIRDYLVARGCAAPVNPGDFFNAAYVSLADGYRVAIADLEQNTGKCYSEIYIVGGGAKNGYLNALTEKHTGKRVVALPIEATAIGNLSIQIKRNK